MMMKFACLFALALLALVPPTPGRAETPVTSIQSLKIQLWPDYDRPAVLVLISGRLPSSAPLPAVVNLPLLPDAKLNAVARADANGNLFADIVYTANPGRLSLSTPAPEFRVEYYVPYRVEGDEHHFTFDWLADVPVAELSVIVQKPVSATSLVTRPPAAEVVRGADGITYHVLPTSSAPAREPLSVQLSYAMTTAALSAEPRPAAAPAPPAAPAAAAAPVQAIRPPTAPAETAPGLGWGFLLAIVVTAAASIGITWQIARTRIASGVAGETPNAERPAERRCPNCGLACGIDARFCGGCGRKLRHQADSGDDAAGSEA